MTKRLIIVFAALFIIVILAASLGMKKSPQDNQQISKKTSGQQSYLSNPTIFFPSVSARQNLDIKRENLALEMSNFIPSDAKGLSIQKITYESPGNKSYRGFEIYYFLDQPIYNLTDFYKSQIDIAIKEEWTILASRLESDQAFIELEKNIVDTNYKIHFRIIKTQEGLQSNLRYLIQING